MWHSNSQPTDQESLALWTEPTSHHICRKIINNWFHAYTSPTSPPPKILIFPYSIGKCFCQAFLILWNLVIQRREVRKAKEKEWREEMVSSLPSVLVIQLILVFPGAYFGAHSFLRWQCPICKLPICS